MGEWVKKIRTVEVQLRIVIGSICVLHLAMFQGPLLTFALSVTDLKSSGGIVQLLSLQVLQVTLLATLLYWTAAISISIMQFVTMVLVIANAVALYFMSNYGIEIDRSMIANILNTDAREAGELWHPTLIPFVFFCGIVPAAFIAIVRIDAPRRIWCVASGLGSILILAVWMAITSFTLLWFDQHASRLGSKILPWSYIVNLARHYNRTAMDGREQVLLPNAQFNLPEQVEKTIVVLVIGEAVRGDNLSLLGYDRETNPFTKELGIIPFPIGPACATNTISSVACILTHEGSTASSRTRFEPLPSYLSRHGIFTIFRTNNSGPPPMKVDLHQTVSEIIADCEGGGCPKNGFDEVLNWNLAEQLEATDATRIFITLHQTGSHGPAYHSKYPPEFEHFTPVCKTVQIAKCSLQELTNAYDNTIRYTDSLIADLITQLQSIPNANATIIYVSDHGQSLGEDGFYLHGAPMAIAPAEQTRVPFLVWMSDGFANLHSLTAETIIRETTYPHDFPFHSVMGAFGLRSEIYKPHFDIFSQDGVN